jgi:hypothetical protein
MAQNIIIGIGGTGAKVVEAIAHCLSAGLGPDAAQIGFVDQDKSNGNVGRAIETVETIQKARQNWRPAAGEHKLEEGDLLRCDLTSLDPPLWIPYQRERTSLFQALGILKSDRAAFDLLFMPDSAEQNLELDIGFQAKAHVGSAAIASAIENDSGSFWKQIREQISGAQAGTTVNIVLAGSAFGGSGAAGFPTIARLLRGLAGAGNVRIGGILMLPYFKFSDPSLATAAKFEELVPQTRGALRYYANLVEREALVFDQLYLVGWNRYFDLGYSEAGAGRQKNPPLVPELIAALAACRFLTDVPTDPPARTELFVSTRSSETALAWADMPSAGGGIANANAAYLKLARQIRFALAWKHWHPFLLKSGQVWKRKFAGFGWYRRHRLGELDRTGTEIREAVNSMSGVVDSLLRWATTVEAYWSRQEGTNRASEADPAQKGFDLWKLSDSGLVAVDLATPTDPVALRDAIDESSFGRLFAGAITARSDGDRLSGADWMLEQLHRGSSEERSKGLGGIVSAMHRLSAVRTAPQGSD